jgi:hypothetical protein
VSRVQVVVFHEAKAGSADVEWEDGAGHDSGDPATGRNARCIVVDGATEAYDSIRWVGQLVDSFLGIHPAGGAPALTDRAMDEWFGLMQDRWVQNAPAAFASVFEERKFREDGSFATLLGCEIHGLGGSQPRWSAVALGDTVLFHVRGSRVLAQFPALAAEDFGLNPDGVFTQPSARARMRARLGHADGSLAVGDRLFLATDAFAEWMVRVARSDADLLWRTLVRLDHPARFRRIVADRRRAGEMKNDDVTLMRVEITDSEPELLVVCQ